MSLSGTGEERLVSLAKVRDQRAWTQIYDLHFAQLHRYAYSRLRSQEEAEDVACQVFVEALRAIDQFVYQGKPLIAWLYRIAANLVNETLRDRKRRAQWVELGAKSPGLPSTTEMGYARCEILDVINRLTPDQRDVIILRYLLALPIKEVAAAIGKPETAVVSLQGRGLRALRRALEETGDAMVRSNAA